MNPRIRYCILVTLSLLFLQQASAQLDSIQTEPRVNDRWRWTGYVETYLTDSRPKSMNKRHPSFQYSYHKLGGIQLNLGLIELNYQGKRLRGNLGLGAGTYMDRNLSGEPSGWKNVTQANLGIALDRKQHWWIDAGVLPSHIGAESAIGGSCINVTRSLVADNSPYYESGIRLSGKNKSQVIQFQLLLLNGWQRIQFIPQRQSLAVGHQFTFQPNAKWFVQSSSFIGEASPGISRLYHNFFIQWQPDSSWRILAGWDVGVQEQNKKRYHWHSPMLQTSWTWQRHWSLGGRIEYFSDPEAVMISRVEGNAFQGWSSSLNLDWKINNQLMWRLEYRHFQNKQSYFGRANHLQTKYTAMTTAVVFWL